jgi:hypothetical protein
MKRLILPISVIAVAVIIYPKVDRYFKQRPVKEPDLLRSEIVGSIRNPFVQADTLLLETNWMLCGNSDPDELPNVFETLLEEGKYRQLLATRVNKPILTMAEFNKVMDTVLNIRFKGEYPASLWDTCRVGKVSADIIAEQISPKQVRLYENYVYADTAKFLRKDFSYYGGKWTFSISDSSTQILTK